ncbi:MAG TPA: type II toxin-antitoxin system RelE/ParE family toxin [Saprospiraceae bacterium]|nr:type II toxin-antitoxin system RelE/ParE family toxin [Saprospiraceae bacterium]
MDKALIFTEETLQHFESTYQYLEENFSQGAAGNFVQNVHIAVNKIVRYPEMHPISKNDPAVRFYRMDKHRRIYYEETTSNIRVLAIFDTRQNPDKNPY